MPFAELKGKTYIIPYQQSGYKWTSSNVEELLCDLREFIEETNSKKRIYCLQPLAVVPVGVNRYVVLMDNSGLLRYIFCISIFMVSPLMFSTMKGTWIMKTS